MGRLDISVDEIPLAFTGKAQRKPLALLKVLLTHSQGVEATAALDLLWPDLDGDAARNSLDLATHRLRKLLGHKESVLALRGRLTLSPDTVWVDAFAFERLGAGSLLDEQPPTAAHLLQLYRGPLLLGEELAPVAAARDRLRGQFVRAVRTLIDRLGAAADWDALTSLCLRAVELEPLEETLYRDWMQQLLACGQGAQATLIYKRCERTLERALGRKPSSATRRLVEDCGLQ
jgi:DNA-binding SARP family transcriptional activator